MTTPTKPALPEPDAYLQIGMKGRPNEGDRIARTYLPKHYDKTWWRFEPLYTQAAIEAAVAEARAVPEWPCACDEQGRGEPGVTCGDCPRDYGHCVTPSPTPVEQPKPVARVREALDTVMALQWFQPKNQTPSLRRRSHVWMPSQHQ